MGKSSRSKRQIKFRNLKRAKVFEPAEEARRQRLAEKLLGNVKAAIKEEKKQGNSNETTEKVDEDAMITDEQTSSATNTTNNESTDSTTQNKVKTGSWKKKVKKVRSFKSRRRR